MTEAAGLAIANFLAERQRLSRSMFCQENLTKKADAQF